MLRMQEMTFPKFQKFSGGLREYSLRPPPFMRGILATHVAFSHCYPPHGKILKKGPETKYLKTLHPIRGLHLRDLTLKITMLIALLSGQRCQTIHALDISDMQVVCHPNQQYVFQINKLLKTSRPGKHFSLLTLQAYPADEQLCIFKTIQVYLVKTKPLRGNHTQLLISYQQPHKPVTTYTIAICKVAESSSGQSRN